MTFENTPQEREQAKYNLVNTVGFCLNAAPTPRKPIQRENGNWGEREEQMEDYRDVWALEMLGGKGYPTRTCWIISIRLGQMDTVVNFLLYVL